MPIDPALRRRFDPFLGHDQRALLADPVLSAKWEEAFCQLEGYERPAARITEHQVEGPIGPFRVRVYEPDAGIGTDGGDDPTRPVLVWAHGGGFLAGSIDMVEGDVLSREVCNRADAVVVSVDYHLAGTATGVSYPTLHREVAAAFEWARERYPSAADVVLGGGSAGGNLALAAALQLRNDGRPLPDRLAIVYPALHRDHRIAPDVEAELATMPVGMQLNQRMLDFMYREYSGAATDTELVAPGEGVDLAGLPPCLVLVSEYDGLRSSGERFAEDAQAAGVDVDLYVATGMPHGHLNMTPQLPEVVAGLDLIATLVRPR